MICKFRRVLYEPPSCKHSLCFVNAAIAILGQLASSKTLAILVFRPSSPTSPSTVTIGRSCEFRYATRSRSSPSKSFGHVSPRRSRPVEASVGVVFTPAPTAAAFDFITSSKPLAVSL